MQINQAKKLSKKFNAKEILDWITQSANGLKYLHSDKVNIIHRDIKPALVQPKKLTPTPYS